MTAAEALTVDATPALTQSALDEIASVVIAQWTAALGSGDPRLAALGNLHFSIANLVGGQLGYAEGNTILVDADAAGHGWFVDSSPYSSSEFQALNDSVALRARLDTAAYAHMDLVTALAHEMGHVLGFTHADAAAHPVMSEDLEPGVRYLLDVLHLDGDPDQPVSDKTLLEMARRAAMLEAAAQPQGMPQYEFDLNRPGGGVNSAIDWQSGGPGGWNTGYSPFVSDKTGKTGTVWGNFSDFLFKPLSGSAVGNSAHAPGLDDTVVTKSVAPGKAAKGGNIRI
jgi:hypothetical protein